MVNCTASEAGSLCIVMGLALDEYTIHGNDQEGGQMLKGSVGEVYYLSCNQWRIEIGGSLCLLYEIELIWKDDHTFFLCDYFIQLHVNKTPLHLC